MFAIRISDVTGRFYPPARIAAKPAPSVTANTAIMTIAVAPAPAPTAAAVFLSIYLFYPAKPYHQRELPVRYLSAETEVLFSEQ